MRSTSDAPVTVTGIHVERDGDGVSYLSLGFPGATVQVLQRLNTANLSDDLRRLAPDIIVLAFGTNEGFNDALDIGAYTAEYQSVIDRLNASRPNARLVLIGPPDGARACRAIAGGASHDCPAGALRTDVAAKRALPLRDAAEAGAGARGAAPARRKERRGVLGLVVGNAGTLRRADLGGGDAGADGA